MSTVPDAAVPSARYTVLLIVVSAGPCACNVVDNVNAVINASMREINTSAAIGRYLFFTANDLGISFSLLVSARHPNSGQ
jgi:hypothetical protein